MNTALCVVMRLQYTSLRLRLVVSDVRRHELRGKKKGAMHEIAVVCAEFQLPRNRTKGWRANRLPRATSIEKIGYRSRRRTTPEQATSAEVAFIQCLPLPGGGDSTGTFTFVRAQRSRHPQTTVFFYPAPRPQPLAIWIPAPFFPTKSSSTRLPKSLLLDRLGMIRLAPKAPTESPKPWHKHNP
jgi:hypothetical protein